MSVLTARRREAATGYLWSQAWMLGFILFAAVPIVVSLYLGFTDWNGVQTPRWIGLQNYNEIFQDELFWQSTRVTLVFAVLYLPASIIIGFGMALLMNQKLRGISVFRTIYYLPSVLSGVAVAVLWSFVFNRDFGALNWVLGLVGIPPVPWLSDPFWVLPALVIMQLWGVGASVIIYLGGLQGIPTELYEVAKLDGAGWFHTLRAVTLPMMSPVFLLQIVVGLIGTLQIFTQAYVITSGGPNYATYFFSLNIFNTAFQQFRFGYACALSWVLFLGIAALTAIVFLTSRRWVFYAGSRGQR